MSCPADTDPRTPRPSRGRRAVVLLATGEAAEAADRLRKRFDPEWFERVPPHVSLAGPFDAEAVGPDDELAEGLREAARELGSFHIELAGPGAFVAPELVLYLSVADPRPVLELRRVVCRSLRLGEGMLPFVPHLTLGRFASQASMAVALAAVRLSVGHRRSRTQAARDEFARRPEGAGRLGFPVDAVHLFAEHPETGVYSSVATAPLGRSAPGVAAN